VRRRTDTAAGRLIWPWGSSVTLLRLFGWNRRRSAVSGTSKRRTTHIDRRCGVYRHLREQFVGVVHLRDEDGKMSAVMPAATCDNLRSARDFLAKRRKVQSLIRVLIGRPFATAGPPSPSKSARRAILFRSGGPVAGLRQDHGEDRREEHRDHGAFAEHLTLSEKTVMKWIRAGVLPAYQFEVSVANQGDGCGPARRGGSVSHF